MKIFNLCKLKKTEIEEIFQSVVVIPTETVYGLAGRIDNDSILKEIFTIKGRPSDNPLIVHISSITMLKKLIDQDIPKEYTILMDKYWPGPLTLLFKCTPAVSKIVTGNSDIIAVRMPKSQYLRNIINLIDCPVAAPSANTSGNPSPTQVSHVIDDLGEKVKYYIDDGPCEIGLESTIFGIINNEYILFRPGAITKEHIEDALHTRVTVRNKVITDQVTICPGQKYKHYSPKTPLFLFKSDSWQSKMIKAFGLLKDKKIGLLKRANVEYSLLPFYKEYNMGTTLPEFSRNLFSGIIALDGKCDYIFVLEVDSSDEGMGIMDRLEKAAHKII